MIGRLPNIMHQHPTELRAILMKRDILEVYICGLALDVCVGMFLLETISPCPCPWCLHWYVSNHQPMFLSMFETVHFCGFLPLLFLSILDGCSQPCSCSWCLNGHLNKYFFDSLTPESFASVYLLVQISSLLGCFCPILPSFHIVLISY